ncbi:hypothetical protein WJM95_24590 [Streptomyces sp. f51]|uniref:hypothetical protein n=1 Tax=Streptomyces sp. NPDC051997 TaxID=3155611 RepID=UPI0030CE5F1A
MAGRIVRRGACVVFGALWWFSVLRLAVVPGAGVLEGTVAAGGWGLSLLPVHCVPKSRAAGAVGADRWRGRGRATRRGGGAWARRVDGTGRGSGGARGRGREGGTGRGGATKAWRRRRWGGGSGRW